MFENYSICSRCAQIINKLNHADVWVGEDDRSACYGMRHVPSNPDTYKSIKFGNDIRAEILYILSLDSNENESVGDADTFGYYALFHEFNAIMEINSQGFVSIHVHNSPAMVSADWNNIERDYDGWLDSPEDDYYFTAEERGKDEVYDISDPYDKEYDL